MKRGRFALGALVALLCAWLVGCNEGASPADAGPDARWGCPPSWVPYAQGGCGPAVLLCAPDGGALAHACDGVELSRPPSLALDDGGTAQGFWRAPDGALRGGWRAPGEPGGPPREDWSPDGVPRDDWTPDAGVERCPEGWRRAGDQGCDPALSEDCPEGSGALPGGGCTRTARRDCPEGDWPDVGAETVGARVVRVRSGADPAGADGSTARPYATLAEGLSHAGDDGWVLLAPGTYETLVTLTAPAHVVGVCAARVTLAGPASVDVTTPPTLDVTGASARLDLRGVTLQGGFIALRATQGASVRARSVRFQAPLYGGARAQEGGSLRLEDALVSGVRGFQPAGAPTPSGFGANAIRGGHVTVSRAQVRASLGVGLFASDPGSTLEAEDVTLTGLHGLPALGVQVQLGAQAETRRLAITDVTGSAWSLAGAGSGLLVEGGYASGLRAPSATTPAVALLPGEGSTLTARGVTLRDTQGFHAILSGFDTTFTLERSTLTDAQGFTSSGVISPGSVVSARPGATVRGCLFARNVGAALVSTGDGASLTVRDSLVVDTPARTETGLGTALLAFGGGALDAEGVRIERSVGLAVESNGEGSALTLRGSIVRETAPFDSTHGALGVNAAAGGALTVERSLLADNTFETASASSGGTLDLRDSVVRDTRVFEGNRVDTNAVVAVTGGVVRAVRVLLAHNQISGVIAGHGGTVTLEDSVVRDTWATGEDVGFGLATGGYPEEEGSLTARRVLVQGSVGFGVGAFTGATLTFEDGVVEDSRPVADGRFGQGAQASTGGRLFLRRTLLRRNMQLGVSAYRHGSWLSLEDSAVVDTRPVRSDTSELGGLGAMLGYGATGVFERVLFVDNRQHGVWVLGEGTRLDARDVLIVGVLPTSEGFGLGALAQEGAVLDARRLAVRGVHGFAFGALPLVFPGAPTGPLLGVGGARLSAADVFLADVGESSIRDEGGGAPVAYGVHVGRGCSVALTRSVLDTGGWGFFQAQGALALRDAVIARQRNALGAVNGLRDPLDLVLERVSSLNNRRDDVLRDVALPEALLPPPPAPCALPPCR